MPLYEYECGKCGHRFDVWHAPLPKRVHRCPSCDHKADKVFHAVGLIFKGSGFHTTDYCNKSHCPPGEKKCDGPAAPKADAPGRTAEVCSKCEK